MNQERRCITKLPVEKCLNTFYFRIYSERHKSFPNKSTTNWGITKVVDYNVGRIKSTMIRKAAAELAESVEGFNADFEHNKKMLHGTIFYKSVRNKVAGAISGIKKQQKLKSLKLNKEQKTTI